MTILDRIVTYEKYLKGYAMRLTLHRGDAEDLYQDTIEKILLKQDQFVEDKNFKSWAVTVMRNTFIDQYRKNKRKTSFDGEEDELTINQGYSQIVVDEIYKAIETLPEAPRKVITMRLEGYKFKDIANVMDITEVLTRGLYFRYIRELRKKLEMFR